jgi:hypothetical protein
MFPKGKKGDLPDLLIFVILIFILGAGLFVLSFVIPAITDGLLTGGLNTTAEGQAAIDTLTTYGTEGLQNGFLLLFAGLILATLISSFFVKTHPAFIFLYIIFLGLTVFVGTYLQNAYQVLIENAAFSGIVDGQGGITTVFENLTNIIIGVGVLSIVIIFGKFSSFGNRAGQGGSL